MRHVGQWHGPSARSVDAHKMQGLASEVQAAAVELKLLWRCACGDLVGYWVQRCIQFWLAVAVWAVGSSHGACHRQPYY